MARQKGVCLENYLQHDLETASLQTESDSGDRQCYRCSYLEHDCSRVPRGAGHEVVPQHAPPPWRLPAALLHMVTHLHHITDCLELYTEEQISMQNLHIFNMIYIEPQAADMWDVLTSNHVHDSVLQLTCCSQTFLSIKHCSPAKFVWARTFPEG